MLSGTYKCLITQTFNGGVLRKYGKLILRQENGSLSGSMFPPMFWLNSTFSYGKTDGKNFSFTVSWGTPCQQFSMNVEGVSDGENIIGHVYSPMGEYTLEGKRY